MARELPTSLMMFIAYRSAEARIHEAIRAAGFADFTAAQGRLLAGIDPDGTRISVLAERALVTKQTATALVDRLEAAGYVERFPDPADGRARLVRMTPLCQQLVPVARSEEQRIEEEWAEHLGSRRMGHLREALTRLGEISDPHPEA